jgi:serine/threonine protein kinase
MEKIAARALLGIAGDASPSEVEEAYRKRASEVRERFKAARRSSMRTQCQREFDALEEARDSLLAAPEFTDGGVAEPPPEREPIESLEVPSPQEKPLRWEESGTNRPAPEAPEEEAQVADAVDEDPRASELSMEEQKEKPQTEQSELELQPAENEVDEIERGPQAESRETKVSVPSPLDSGGLFASRFELLREVERAETGPVWLVRDHGVERQEGQVALKFLPELVSGDKPSMERLKNEIDLRTALKHSNILRIHGLVKGRKSVAIQMEYSGGQTLTQLRLTRPGQIFDVRDLEAWVKELCAALDYAHKEVGVVHGEIKPSNLIVSPAGSLMLKDFGIANCIKDSIRRLTGTLDTGDMLPYQSPQQAAGERPAITDDIYSLGATIYEFLTSDPPFHPGDHAGPVSGQIPSSIAQRRIELEKKGEPVPKNWEETVAACLGTDPAQRPQSANEVARRLERTGPASPVPSTAPSPNPPNRRPWLVTDGIIVLFALASVLTPNLFRHPNKPDTGKGVATGPPSPSVSDQPSVSNQLTTSPTVSTPSPKLSPTLLPETTSKPAPEISPTLSPSAIPEPSEKQISTPIETPAAAPSSPPSSQSENDATREEVIKRINALPGITTEGKANLIEKMRKARSMERLAVFPFDVGQTTLRRAAEDDLVRMFEEPQMRDKFSDPTTILVVAGYADTGGRVDSNLRISRQRAEYVRRILKQRVNLLNAIQSIGMGGTELLNSSRPDQNRAVEIWAVVPL